MAANSSKTSILLNIDKDLKEELTIIAESQNRSLSNLIITILKEYNEKNKQ